MLLSFAYLDVETRATRKVEGVGTPASSAMSLEEIPAATSVAWASSASCSATAPTSGVGGFAVLARR
jgi:hypothetical protein